MECPDESRAVESLLEHIFEETGHDYRDYVRSHILRRIRSFQSRHPQFADLSELQENILDDKKLFSVFLGELSVHTTELFRDPEFYQAFRAHIIPWLRTFPSFKIWHAGCSTGEEVYSMAILLKEENLYERALIYATDLSPQAIAKARTGIFRINNMQSYTRNYQEAGGTCSLSDYYTAKYDGAVMQKALAENVVFSTHNLATDRSFGEMHLILCRNVLIYFNRGLQDRVLALFHDSLIRRGHLCLSTRETLQFSSQSAQFDTLQSGQKIYRRRD